MPSKAYWNKRFNKLQDQILNEADNLVERTEKAYDKAISDMQRDIDHWYARFANNNEIDLVDAKKLLKTNELKELKWTVEEYIKYGRENAIDQHWMKELENASAKVHISRLEAMQLQLRHKAESLHKIRENGLNDLLPNLYKDKYYKTIYEIQRGFHIGKAFTKLDDRMIDQLISKPWAPDGLDFSKRIWRDRDLLVDTLNKEFRQSLIRGEAPDKVIDLLSQKFSTSKYKAGRLVMTESAFFSSAAQQESFKEMDVEEYQYVATLDTKTSPICREMDNKVLRMEDYEVGVTAPPLHAFCRSTTVPYFPDNITQRIAKNADGKSYIVEGDISYDEWYNKYIKQNKQVLPYVKHAIIPRRKFTEYALNPDKDPNKAKGFEKALGYNQNDADLLIKNIKNNLSNFEAKNRKSTKYGLKYSVLMSLMGKNGKRANVMTGWIIEKGKKYPRLTSAYVTSKKWRKRYED